MREPPRHFCFDLQLINFLQTWRSISARTHYMHSGRDGRKRRKPKRKIADRPTARAWQATYDVPDEQRAQRCVTGAPWQGASPPRRTGVAHDRDGRAAESRKKLGATRRQRPVIWQPYAWLIMLSRSSLPIHDHDQIERKTAAQSGSSSTISSVPAAEKRRGLPSSRLLAREVDDVVDECSDDESQEPSSAWWPQQGNSRCFCRNGHSIKWP